MKRYLVLLALLALAIGALSVPITAQRLGVEPSNYAPLFETLGPPEPTATVEGTPSAPPVTVHLGTAGAWPGEPCGESWYSWVSTGIETAPPERVALDKLANGTTNEYTREMAERARLDPVDGRVWLLFNEPDTGSESAYEDDPKLAARVYWEAYVALKAARSDVIVGGPNYYWAGEIDTQTNTYEKQNWWFLAFTKELDTLNLRHAVQAKIEVLTLHDYAGRYHDGTRTVIDWGIMEEHIDWLRFLGKVRDCFDTDVPIWITETGMLWPEADTQAFMNSLLIWLGGAEALGIERCYWFVSYDSWWWANVPNTCLYDPSGQLTALGQQWKAAGE